MVAVGAVALALVLVGAAWRAVDTGPTVTFLGDSITVISADDISAALGRDYRPEFSAVIGIQTGQLLPAARTATRADPDQVVIDLGTNDVLQDAPLDQAAANLAELVSLFPRARCIQLVNINTNMARVGRSFRARAVLLNAAIDRLGATDRRINVIDWNSMMSADVAANPPVGSLTSDTIHPVPAGRTALARAIRAALDRCGG